MCRIAALKIKIDGGQVSTVITENKYPILEFDENKNLSSQAYAHVFSGNFDADCVKNPWRATARLRIFALSATKLCSKICVHFL